MQQRLAFHIEIQLILKCSTNFERICRGDIGLYSNRGDPFLSTGTTCANFQLDGKKDVVNIVTIIYNKKQEMNGKTIQKNFSDVRFN